MRDLTAKAATDTVVVDLRDRVFAQRIGIGRYGQRRTSREPDAGVVAGADVGIDAEPCAHHTLAFTQVLGNLAA